MNNNISELFNNCVSRSKYWQKQYAQFRKQILANYRLEFIALDGFVDFSNEIGNVLDGTIPQAEKPVLQFALLRIHEKAIKIFREAQILLENGSASGALARWRTLFEFSVISSYLIKYPDLAEKYINHALVDDYKCAKRLVDYKERLHLENYDLSAYDEIKSNYERIKIKYGWDGRDYEWAKSDAVKKPDLFTLSKEVNLEHLCAYVDEANKYNHHSMYYLLNDRGSKAPNDIINSYLFSPFDLELPIQLIAISLCKVNQNVMLGYLGLEGLNKGKEDAINKYLETNDDFPKMILSFISSRQQEVSTDAD